MFLIASNGEKAVAPGYMLGYGGEAMMAEYGRYMATLPLFLFGNISVLGWSAFSLFQGGNSSVLLAFALFMGVFSIRMFSQRLIRVCLDSPDTEISRAPLLANVNTAVQGGALALIGFKYQTLTGEFDTLVFKVTGWVMIGIALSCFLALRNVSRRK